MDEVDHLTPPEEEPGNASRGRVSSGPDFLPTFDASPLEHLPARNCANDADASALCVASHVRLMGRAGSALALALTLQKMGKTVRVLS